MVKYIIEGGSDFYTELYNSLDIEEDEQKTDNDNNICLITNLPLTTNFVVMECGHKFNYNPLYKDLLNHKQKFNVMEFGNGKLNTYEIRCPYCRKKQTTLLPFYEELGLEKVNGVNFYDPTIKEPIYHSKGEKCSYKYPNEQFDPSKPESETNPKYKNNIKCNHYYATQIQIADSKNQWQYKNFGDNNFYCYNHKILMIKFYKAEQKQKEKEIAKAAKQKAKEEIKAIKELEKQKVKEEKQKAKQKKTTENSQLIVSLSENSCIAILKSGINKGKQCGCKIKTDNMFCSRHLKVENNNIINN